MANFIRNFLWYNHWDLVAFFGSNGPAARRGGEFMSCDYGWIFWFMRDMMVRIMKRILVGIMMESKVRIMMMIGMRFMMEVKVRLMVKIVNESVVRII